MNSLKCVLASIALGGVLMSPLSVLAENIQQEKAHHPHINAALKEMREVKKELEDAANDFGGHKVSAIHALDEAIKQLQLALEFRLKNDNKHEH